GGAGGNGASATTTTSSNSGASATPAVGTTFVVTNTFYGKDPTEVGTFAWAVAQANTNPGTDTIDVRVPGGQINVDGFNGSELAEKIYLAEFTDSVVINGNGATLVGNPQWISDVGTVLNKNNPPGGIYNPQPPAVVLQQGVGFALVNDRLEVTVDNLNANGLGTIAKMRGAGFLQPGTATLTWSNSSFGQIMSFFTIGGTPAHVSAFEANGTLNLTNVQLDRANGFAGPIDLGPESLVFLGAISGEGRLNMTNSQIGTCTGQHAGCIKEVADGVFRPFYYGSYPAGAIVWNDGTANIVSSIIQNSGGIQAVGANSVINFVNSILYMQPGFVAPADPFYLPGEYIQQTNRVLAFGGVVNLLASSVISNGTLTEDPSGSSSGGSLPFDFSGMPLTAGGDGAGGVINVQSSAIAPLPLQFGPDNKNAYDELGGDITSDDYSYFATVPAQDSAAIKTLVGNPNILTSDPTDGSTYPTSTSLNTDVYLLLPNGGYPLNPGILVGVVPDANTVNALINPINGTVITTDVYGNPRTAFGRRDVGAVQATQQGTDGGQGGKGGNGGDGAPAGQGAPGGGDASPGASGGAGGIGGKGGNSTPGSPGGTGGPGGDGGDGGESGTFNPGEPGGTGSPGRPPTGNIGGFGGVGGTDGRGGDV
ncbi:MAG: hypothetical protein O3A42_18980, partial [Actinobacteria bacterium]|nr:hypothetical protein [Actinomycetota bacterium]